MLKYGNSVARLRHNFSCPVVITINYFSGFENSSVEKCGGVSPPKLSGGGVLPHTPKGIAVPKLVSVLLVTACVLYPTYT